MEIIKVKTPLLDKVLYRLLDLFPEHIITDYAMEQLELYDHDTWIDHMAGSREM